MPTKTETNATVAATPATKAVGGDHDRVVIASRKADGTPDQTPDFTYIGDEATSIAAAKRQLREQAVSAVDVAERGAGAPAGPGEPDPATKELQDKQASAAKAAESAAEAEVKARFESAP